ncbi:MAG: lipopolysaccharide assembly protein LapB [Pseudomonadota bacterium]
MDFDLQWMLIGLPIAFALGWLTSRLDLRQRRRENRDAPRAYFKGLNLLLHEQPDKAIDAFVDAVRHDPDTTELHFALGNLFRRRGEFERAVRVHEHLLARGDLRAADRERAQRALAEDFAKAGLFDRAETAWRALEGTRFEREARLALLALAERSRDWPRALELAAGLDEAAEGSFATRRAHYECEQVLASDAAGKDADAESALARAHALAPQAARPLLLAGQRHARAGRPAEALAAWDELRAVQPGAFLLVALEYAQAARAAGRIAAARDTLVAEHARRPSVELLAALDRLDAAAGGEDDAPARAAARWTGQLEQAPSLAAAERLLALPAAQWPAGGHEALRAAVARASRPLQRYRCAACGFEAQNYFWQCPGCLSWDSYPPQRIETL